MVSDNYQDVGALHHSALDLSCSRVLAARPEFGIESSDGQEARAPTAMGAQPCLCLGPEGCTELEAEDSRGHLDVDTTRGTGFAQHLQ